MAETTKIEWCDHSASPWHGCTKIAAGCENCYAARQAVRNPGTLGIWGDDGVRVKSKSFSKNLRAWNKQAEAAGKPVTVFPSICDPFEDRPELVPWRQEMFSVADECPWVSLLLLTKRPENVRRMWPVKHGSAAPFPGMPGPLGQPMPCVKPNAHRANVWLGTSIATQADADKNIPELLKCRGLSPVLFLSAEPLIGPIDLGMPEGWAACDVRSGIGWVIIGGESGPHARTCDVAWIRSLVEQGKAAGVPCLVKQLGSHVLLEGPATEPPFGCRWTLKDSKGGDMNEWANDLRVREFPNASVEGGR